MRNLTEANMTEAVIARTAPATDARLSEIMASLVKHLHAFVREVELTPEEWFQGVQFLTRTGQTCDDKRQEFILLSDTLGVSMLVDAIANRTSGGSTESSVLGPFWREGTPFSENGAHIAKGVDGAKLDVEVRVSDEGGRPLPGAEVDVWHTSPDGLYDTQIGDGTEHNMRARFRADAAGLVRFTSVMPQSYPIPDDGPVGDMLKALGRHPFRPAHVHFWLTAPGYRDLVTQLFVEGDEYLDADAVFGVKNSLVVPFERMPGENTYRVRYEVRLAQAARQSAAAE
jgi:protocatechuate 3,4-dioxygenase beta subunit